MSDPEKSHMQTVLAPYEASINSLLATHAGAIANEFRQHEPALAMVPALDLARAGGVFVVFPDTLPITAPIRGAVANVCSSPVVVHFIARQPDGGEVYLFSRPGFRLVLEHLVLPPGFVDQFLSMLPTHGMILAALFKGSEMVAGPIPVLSSEVPQA